MKIQYIQNNYQNNRHFISFSSGNIFRMHSAKDFQAEYSKFYKNVPLSSTIKEIIDMPGCYINRGSKNIVFKIPKIDNYILRMPLKIWKDLTNITLSEFRPIKDCYEVLNLGQPIIQNSQRVQICKKQLGEPVSKSDWFKLRNNPNLVTHDSALNFLNNLEALSEFPIDSYREAVKILGKINKHEIDYLNAGNFLIDKENKQINRVDVTDIESTVPTPCTKENIIFPLINVFMHSYFKEALNEEEQIKLDKATKEIIRKCNLVCKENNIVEDKNYPYDTWKNRIIDFMGEDLYKDLQRDISKTVNNYFEDIYG